MSACEPILPRRPCRSPSVCRNDLLGSIALKNPQNAFPPNSHICAATRGISADFAIKAHKKVARGEGRALSWVPE